MKIRTQDLTEAALDWAVAKCEGHHWRTGDSYPQYAPEGTSCWTTWRVSSDWAQAGPIIEREEVSLQHTGDAAKWRAHVWNDYRLDFWPIAYGPTPLIAAMRCYVASKLGDDVDVPKELT